MLIRIDKEMLRKQDIALCNLIDKCYKNNSPQEEIDILDSVESLIGNILCALEHNVDIEIVEE